MTRVTTAIAVLVLALGASACMSSEDSAGTGPGTGAPSGEPVNLTMWTGFTNRELGVIKQVVAGFEDAHPNVHVKVIGGVDDDKIIAAIRGGNAPDVAHSFTSDNTGAFCPSGSWIDLGPYMKKDGISEDIFPKAPRYYTQFEGTRCALPMLADTYGLYYNKDLFAKAGISGPPKTVSELTEDAKKLTTRKPDGSLDVVGFNPVQGWYENAASHYAPSWGADWTNSDGKSTLASDPGWAAFLKWQKGLVDWYGYDDLVKWQASAGDEFSPSNAFERGKVAMHMDGEWRVAFIANEVPTLNYGTAPFPVDDAQPDLYGAGYVTGSILGIPKTSGHKDEAWQLVKYLGTSDSALAELSNGIRNVPTTTTSLKSPDIKPDAHFKTFLDIFGNPNTTTTPITRAGAANQELFQSFVEKYQSGHAGDLEDGLKNMDEQIDAQLAQSGGGSDVP